MIGEFIVGVMSLLFGLISAISLIVIAYVLWKESRNKENINIV